MSLRLRLALVALMLAVVSFLVAPVTGSDVSVARPAPPAAVTEAPNIYFYNLDDLRDALPGNVDPLTYMPRLRHWMEAGTRYRQSFVVDPTCCPSRASLMTGRYPHNNGVRLQADGPKFDGAHSMACYLDGAGYATYLSGKFLTSWPRTTQPPCFDHSTVLWSGYRNSKVSVDGVPRSTRGYSTTMLGQRSREYLTQALGSSAPFLLYEAPHAPHWVPVKNPDGTTTRRAVPDTKYASAPVAPCAGPVEADRSDKPAYVRRYRMTTAQGETMCQSQLRAIMTADDEFDATMRLLDQRGELANTLVIFSSDNGYMWSDHGRTEKFVPYEPSIRVPLLLRWPGHVGTGDDQTRQVSYLDLLPTMLEAANIALPTGAPVLDGESLLQPSQRSATYAEYYRDPDNDKTPSWRMVRTPTVKYVETYDQAGSTIFREYYRLADDPLEFTNLLGDGSSANDPTAATLAGLAAQLDAFAVCAGAGCLH